MRRLLTACTAAGVAFVLTACGPSAEEQAAQSAAVASVMAEMYAPNEYEEARGFMDGGDGAIIRFMTEAEKQETDCGYKQNCGRVVVKAKKDCPGGVYVEIAGYDASDSLVGKGIELTFGMSKGEQAKVAIWLSAGSKFKIKEASCR